MRLAGGEDALREDAIRYEAVLEAAGVQITTRD